MDALKSLRLVRDAMDSQEVPARDCMMCHDYGVYETFCSWMGVQPKPESLFVDDSVEHNGIKWVISQEVTPHPGPKGYPA